MACFCHAAFFSLLFFFVCFFNCFRLRLFFYCYPTCSLFLLFFPLMISHVILFYFMMRSLFWCFSTYLCHAIALLFYLFFFSQCCYNLFLLQLFFDFSYCCCIVIAFSTKYHSCILLRNPQTTCRARISNPDSGGRCHLTIPRRFSCPA